MFALILAASEVEAVSMVASVFALTALVIPEVWVFVFELICEVIEVEAFCTSERVARDPEPRIASVKRRVLFVHTSAAREPNVVREREPNAHTLAGIEVIIEPIEVEAFPTAVLVFALITAARDEVAVAMLVLVFELTADVIPDV